MLYLPCDLFGAISYFFKLESVVCELSGRGAFECVRHVYISSGSFLLSVLSVVYDVLLMRPDYLMMRALSFICRDVFRAHKA